MAGTLYIKLDANYADDPKIIEAGEKAEVLYVRSLCLAKRTLSDGFVADSQILRFGLSSVRKRAQKLVEVGLWQRDNDAKGHWIVAWLRHNRPAADVSKHVGNLSDDGRRGNHIRWHVDRGVIDPNCEHCPPVEPPPESPDEAISTPPVDNPGESPPDRVGHRPPIAPDIAPESQSEHSQSRTEQNRSSSSRSPDPDPTPDRTDASDDDDQAQAPPPKPPPADFPTITPAGTVTHAQATNGASLRAAVLRYLHAGPQTDPTRATRVILRTGGTQLDGRPEWPAWAAHVIAEHLAEVATTNVDSPAVKQLDTLVRRYGDLDVLEAIDKAVDQGADKPVNYAMRCLRNGAER